MLPGMRSRRMYGASELSEYDIRGLQDTIEDISQLGFLPLYWIAFNEHDFLGF